MLLTGYFAMPVSIPVRAIVFGGGHGAVPPLRLLAGGVRLHPFRVPPPSLPGRSEDFPDAEQIVLGNYEDIASSISFDECDYVFIMTYSHAFDYAILGRRFASLWHT